MTSLLSVVIPSRNELFLNKTVIDILSKAVEDIEVIVVLEGYWSEIIDDKRVHYIHFTNPRGMRQAINAGVAIAKGDFIMKTDAHCMFEKGFDVILKADCEDDWVVIPRRKRLEPESWTLRDVEKPDVDYMFLTYPNEDPSWGGREFSGREWREKNDDKALREVLIDDCMSFQGSCWFMRRTYFDYLELMDFETYGGFWKEAQEIGFKAWLSGGRVVVNKKTWYAHLHKGKQYGRGYSLNKEGNSDHNKNIQKWMTQKSWHKQIYPMAYLIRKFPGCPMWTPERIKEADYELN
jgi:glycosyltransferase involved in cell wall biosynthesis